MFFTRTFGESKFKYSSNDLIANSDIKMVLAFQQILLKIVLSEIESLFVFL